MGKLYADAPNDVVTTCDFKAKENWKQDEGEKQLGFVFSPLTCAKHTK